VLVIVVVLDLVLRCSWRSVREGTTRADGQQMGLIGLEQATQTDKPTMSRPVPIRGRGRLRVSLLQNILNPAPDFIVTLLTFSPT
jgi:hypothetical protein